MKYLKSYNNADTDLTWKKADGKNFIGPIDDPFYDPENENYFFSTSFNQNPTKTIFFAIDSFSHCLKIIESNPPNKFKIIISPITYINPLPTSCPNVLISTINPPNSTAPIPFRPPICQPNNVIITNNYDKAITLTGIFNSTPLNQPIDPYFQTGKATDLGTLNSSNSLEFDVMIDAASQYVTSPCRIKILFGKFQPMIIFIDKSGYSLFSIEKNPYQPGTINLTIEPDLS